MISQTFHAPRFAQLRKRQTFVPDDYFWVGTHFLHEGFCVLRLELILLWGNNNAPSNVVCMEIFLRSEEVWRGVTIVAYSVIFYLF